MDDFIDLHRVVKNYDVDKVLFNVWNTKQVQNYTIHLNTNIQLYEDGVDSLGVSLTPVYTQLTLQLKGEKGQRIDHVTLNDTGEFYKSFDIKPDAKGFKIIAIDQYGLKDKYGNEIIGLTNENIQVLIKFIEPYFNMESEKMLSR